MLDGSLPAQVAGVDRELYPGRTLDILRSTPHRVWNPLTGRPVALAGSRGRKRASLVRRPRRAIGHTSHRSRPSDCQPRIINCAGTLSGSNWTVQLAKYRVYRGVWRGEASLGVDDDQLLASADDRVEVEFGD